MLDIITAFVAVVGIAVAFAGLALVCDWIERKYGSNE